MEIELEVQVKTSYGQDRIYPINEQAKKIVDLLDKKTLTPADVQKLKDLGFKFKWSPISL